MSVYGSGFITIINYSAANSGGAPPVSAGLFLLMTGAQFLLMTGANLLLQS